MILAHRLKERRTVVPARPPVEVAVRLLPAVRIIWAAVALGALILWLVEVPLYYHAGLLLQNTSQMVALQPAEWRLGLHRLGLSPAVYAWQSTIAVSVMTASMFATGILIFVRRSNEWIALFIAYAFVTFSTGLVHSIAGPALAAAHPELNRLVDAYTAVSGLSWGLPYYALFIIPLAFPDGRFVPRWTLPLAILFTFLSFAQTGSALDSAHWPGPLVNAGSVLWFATVLLAPVYRYRRVSDAVQRRQTKWVLFGLIVGLGVFLAFGLLQALMPSLTATVERAVAFNLIGTSLAFVGFAFLPLTFALAILRYRLWDIDFILNRALVYLALTASVIGLYVLVVAGLGALLQLQGSLALSLPATALVAILFGPLRARLQRGVNRLMYGERHEPYAVLSRLGRQLEGTLAPGAVLPAIVATVAQALKLPYVAIALQGEDGFEVSAAVGSPPDGVVHLPLLYGGETLGRLTLAPRPGEESFSPSERRLLDDLARQAGIAAYAVRVTTDLQRSREHLVTAREEERRRLRRDLHDGLGPSLASVALMADAAQNLLTRDPAAADALLRELKAEAQAATSEIRRVVYQLRPPALDELGLLLALREGAAQYSQNGLRVSVEAPPVLSPLPAAVEVAAYRIAQEAMTNVVRHAQARRCVVTVRLDDALELEIADDGQGMNGATPGVGLSSMRERAEELGGRCEVQPAPGGGVRVRAYLPILPGA